MSISPSSTTPYTYSPLPDGFIRLLRLIPHQDANATIQCRIFHYPLQGTAHGTHLYEALSYVWGTPKNPQPVQILPEDGSGGNSCQFLVTPNLHSALLHLRDRYLERVIWIDAVCINQNDNDEKARQVVLMTKIYDSANRVVVFLGDADSNSDQALETIRKAAEEQSTRSSLGENSPLQPISSNPVTNVNKESVFSLFKRAWFQRTWVLQEVAAARHILVKCGHLEIDGYAFHLGIAALKLFYHADPYLQTLIPPITYLIQGATFRRGRPDCSQQTPSQPGAFFTLSLRPLTELVDMYHTHQVSLRLDKIYALLGMSSDMPISVDYGASWRDVFQKFVQSSFSDEVSVDTWEDLDIAVIRGKGHYIGAVDSVQRHADKDYMQSVRFSGNAEFKRHGQGGPGGVSLQVSAKPIQKGDVLVLFRGAKDPTIIRLRPRYATVIVAAIASTDLRTERLRQEVNKLPPLDLEVIWDIGSSQEGVLRDQDYESLIATSPSGPQQPWPLWRYQADMAVRLWKFGVFLSQARRYSEATQTLQKAIDLCKPAENGMNMDSTDHNQWEEADGRILRTLSGLGDTIVGETPRLVTAAQGDQLLLSWAAEEKPLLSWAVAEGFEAVVQLLLDTGADVNRATRDGLTPLWLALLSKQRAMVALLLERGANMNAPLYRDAIIGNIHSVFIRPVAWAASMGDRETVEIFLDMGATVEADQLDHHTPLCYAAAQGHMGVVDLLLSKRRTGAMARDAFRRTPLSHAAEFGHDDVVRRLLVGLGDVDVDTRDDCGRSPLSYAAEGGHEMVVERLLATGKVDANTVTTSDDTSPHGDEIGWSPLAFAAARGHGNIIELLLSVGKADVELTDHLGRTPLWLAASRGHEAVLRQLLACGANADITDRRDLSAYEVAKQSGHVEVTRLLLAKNVGKMLKAGKRGSG